MRIVTKLFLFASAVVMAVFMSCDTRHIYPQSLLVADSLAECNADSALDYQTAARLWAALRRDFPRTTLVIISERVASVRDADCILVLEHGRIMASGRHQDLLVSAPRYRKMAELQMGGEAV